MACVLRLSAAGLDVGHSSRILHKLCSEPFFTLKRKILNSLKLKSETASLHVVGPEVYFAKELVHNQKDYRGAYMEPGRNGTTFRSGDGRGLFYGICIHCRYHGSWSLSTCLVSEASGWRPLELSQALSCIWVLVVLCFVSCIWILSVTPTKRAQIVLLFSDAS